MYMTLDFFFFISVSLVVPPADHVNMNKTILYYTILYYTINPLYPLFQV